MSKADLEHEFGCESDDYCQAAPDGKHEPNPASLHIEYDGVDAYIDVNCKHCGRSGCAAKFDPQEVAW